MVIISFPWQIEGTNPLGLLVPIVYSPRKTRSKRSKRTRINSKTTVLSVGLELATFESHNHPTF